MSVEKITQSIIDDAQKKAEEILQKAKTQAEDILSVSKKDAQKEVDAILSSAQDMRALLGQKLISSKKNDMKKELLQAKHDKIDEVFAATYDQFSSMDNDSYTKLIKNLVGNAVETGEEVLIMDKAFLGKLTDNFLQDLNANMTAKGLKPSLTLEEGNGNMGPGVILKQGNVFINCTIFQLLADIKEQSQSEINKILF